MSKMDVERFGRVLAAACLIAASGCAGVEQAGSKAGSGASSSSSGRSERGIVDTTQGRPQARVDARRQQAAGQARLGRKKVSLASVELDKRCATLVAPFSLAGNVESLFSMGLAKVSDSVGSMLNSNAQIGSAQSKREIGQSRHRITKSVRDAAIRMNWLPMDAEVYYGQLQHDKLRDQLLSRDQRIGKRLYPAADRMLADILGAIDEPHEYEFQLHILTRSGENAMALPGGFIYLDKALVDDPSLKRKAHYALAHEVAHVLQRHETRNAQARIVDAVSLSDKSLDLMDTIRQIRVRNRAMIESVLAGKLLFERHFSDQELSADGCGVRLLDRTLDDPAELVATVQAFVDRLSEEGDAHAHGTAAGRATGSRGMRTVSGGAPLVVRPNAGGRPMQADDVIEIVTRPVDRHPVAAERIERLREILKVVRDGN